MNNQPHTRTGKQHPVITTPQRTQTAPGQHLGRQRRPLWRGDLQSWVGEGASSARSGEQHSWRRDLPGQGLGAGMSLQHINQSKGDLGGRSGACRTSNISKPTIGWRPLGAGVGLVQCLAITLVVV